MCTNQVSLHDFKSSHYIYRGLGQAAKPMRRSWKGHDACLFHTWPCQIDSPLWWRSSSLPVRPHQFLGRSSRFTVAWIKLDARSNRQRIRCRNTKDCLPDKELGMERTPSKCTAQTNYTSKTQTARGTCMRPANIRTIFLLVFCKGKLLHFVSLMNR
jgi:hypothetical protein